MLGVIPTLGPYFPPPAEMKRQHALSVGHIDFSLIPRERTQTVDSYAGDLAELPVYHGKGESRVGLRIRTHSESEGCRKEEKVCIVKFDNPFSSLQLLRC